MNANRKPLAYATTILSLHMKQCERLIMDLVLFKTAIEVGPTGRPMYWIFMNKN